MFSGFMVNAWIVATIVAGVAGIVGFFTVLRGSAFVAHAIPQGAFAGAAGASLIGVNTIFGLGLFSLIGALGISGLSKRSRRDVATALILVLMLGIGALLLGLSVEYAPEIYSLLFGEVLGVSSNEVLPIAGLAVLCIAVVLVLYRPLMLMSIMPEVSEVRGIKVQRVHTGFLILVALSTTMTVPVVGALLMFSLMVAPPAAAQSLTDKPLVALTLSMIIAFVTVWLSIAGSYLSNWPVGFFVGIIGALFYGIARAWTSWKKKMEKTISVDSNVSTPVSSPLVIR